MTEHELIRIDRKYSVGKGPITKAVETVFEAEGSHIEGIELCPCLDGYKPGMEYRFNLHVSENAPHGYKSELIKKLGAQGCKNITVGYNDLNEIYLTLIHHGLDSLLEDEDVKEKNLSVTGYGLGGREIFEETITLTEFIER